MSADQRTAGHVATLENAYRVATRVAEATNQDMQVSATGKPEQPFIAEPTNTGTQRVIARILADRD